MRRQLTTLVDEALSVRRSRLERPKASPNPSFLTRSMDHPKPVCACGGGCPRCELANGIEDDETEESTNIPIPPVTRPTAPVPAAPSCPSRTRVDDTINLTNLGLQAGFLSGYGIVARMRVLPDNINWDGTQITESLTQTSSTCPSGLTTPGPCNGSSTFTVGAASGGSNVISAQPAMRNRFYDFHTSRSRYVSFLHDSTRNPTGMNSCETTCEQVYSCNGMIVGIHPITRRFSKAVFNGRNVTIVEVTKRDFVSEPGDYPIRTLPEGEAYASVAPEEEEIVG